MSYQTSHALSQEAKYIIKNISEDDASFTKLLKNRFYSVFEKEILFYMRDNLSKDKDNLDDFKKTLNALSIVSPSFSNQNKLLLEIVAQQPELSQVISNIMYDHKEKFSGKELITPLIDAHESKNLDTRLFEVLSNKIVKNEPSDRKILNSISSYADENGHNESIQKFFKLFMSQKAENSSISDEMLEKFVTFEKDIKEKEKANREDFDFEIEEVRLMNKIYSDPNDEDTDDYLALLNTICEGKTPEHDCYFPLQQLAGDLIQIAINEPHLEKNVIEILEPLRKQLNKNLSPLIYYSTARPKIINYFLEDAKKSENASIHGLNELIPAAYFNEEYKDDFLNVVSKGIRNSNSAKRISLVFANTGNHLENEEKEISISMFDKSIQYLMKTALYESKMNSVEALYFAETTKKKMESEIARYYLADVDNDENIASYNKFIKVAAKSPLFSQDEKAKNYYLASLYLSEQAICLPPDAKQNIRDELDKYDLQNGEFLKSLLNQNVEYEKNYDTEVSILSPYELYDNTFSLIEKNLKEDKLNNKDKSKIYQSLNKIENHEGYNKEKFIKLINMLSTDNQKTQNQLVQHNYRRGKEK